MLLREASAAGLFVQAGDWTFFTESHSALYVTNGTAGGTFFLKGFGGVGAITAVGDDVYLTTDTGVWRSDGTTAGTVHVLPMYNNIDGMAEASGFTEMGGEVYFYARVPGVASGLWKTDGTPAGTRIVAPVEAEGLTAAGDTLFFAAPDGDSPGGKELWKTDGTAAGTRMVKNIHPTHGALTFVASQGAFAAVGDKLLFNALEAGASRYSLWASDGTEAGTVKISNVSGGGFLPRGDVVYFGAAAPSGAGQIWKTDGTAAGTVLVTTLPGIGMSRMLEAGDVFNSLWKTDGTAEGTVHVADPDAGRTFASIILPVSTRDGIAFLGYHANAPSGQYSLWTSDGTAAGTVKVRDTMSGLMLGRYGGLGAVGTVALFITATDDGQPELWAHQTATPPPVPEARAEGPSPYAVVEGGTVALHGYTTAEPLPGRPLTYAWDLDDDGAYGETGAAAARGNETGTDPTFVAAGLDGPSSHTVRFRITDATGYSSTATASVSVQNVAPTLNVAGGPVVLTQGSRYTLTLSSSDPGPDTVTRWVIDWGDGVTQTVPGGTTSVTHDYPSTPATYGISVTAGDEDGEYRFERSAALDSAFGSGGVVTSDVSNREDMAADLVLQPDGKIVTVSTIQLSALGGNTAISINRYTPDGRLDPTFGAGGRATFNALAGEATAVALQPDGRIVVAGARRSSGFPYYPGPVLLRLLPDGSLDPTFGGTAAAGAGGFGDAGWFAPDLGASDWINRVQVTPDDRIVAAGSADQRLLLLRFNADGSLDPGFGTGGRAVPDFPSYEGVSVLDLALQPDGNILVVPYYPRAWSFTVLRLNADGSADTTFGEAGRATVDFGPGTELAGSLALVPDGSILVAGSAQASPGSPQPGSLYSAVARLTPSGALDTTFADGGRLRTPMAGTIRLLRDGRFLLGGSYQISPNRWHYFVERYGPDGTPDTALAPNGHFEIDLGGRGVYASAREMVVQPDGAPVLYGGAGWLNLTEALVRLTPPGLSVRVVDAAVPQVSISAPPATPEGETYTLGLSGRRRRRRHHPMDRQLGRRRRAGRAREPEFGHARLCGRAVLDRVDGKCARR